MVVKYAVMFRCSFFTKSSPFSQISKQHCTKHCYSTSQNLWMVLCKKSYAKYCFSGCLNFSTKHKQFNNICARGIRNQCKLLEETTCKFLRQHKRCFSLSSLYQSSKEEWENLLENETKKQKIDSIPVKKENIYTVPNLLSFCRIIVSPYLGYLVVTGQSQTALVLCVIAAVTDVIDGHIARKWPSQQTALGSALDPLADKILVAILSLSLTYVNIIPWVLTGLFIGRDVILILAVFYLRYKTCPPPVTLERYFDPSLVNVKLSPTNLSKANTAAQLVLLWCSLAAPVFGYVDHAALHCLWAVTACTTVGSGVSYILQKDTIRIMKDKENQL